MVSAASGGTADRIAARILFKVLRAGSGTPARYSSTFFGAPLPFAAEVRSPDFTFFMRAMLQELPLPVHAQTTVQPVDMQTAVAFYWARISKVQYLADGHRKEPPEDHGA